MSTQAHWNPDTSTRGHWNLQISSSAVPRHDAGSFKRALPTKPIFAHKADLCAGSHWWCRASCPRVSVEIIIRNKLWPVPKHVQCCFTSTEIVRLIRTGIPGRPPRLSHSSWALRESFDLEVLLYVHRESHVQKTVHVLTVAVPAGSASHPTPLLPGSCLQSDYCATDDVDQALWQRTGSAKDIGSHHLEKTMAFNTWKRRR